MCVCVCVCVKSCKVLKTNTTVKQYNPIKSRFGWSSSMQEVLEDVVTATGEKVASLWPELYCPMAIKTTAISGLVRLGGMFHP